MKKNTLLTILAIIALGLAGYAAYSSYQIKKELTRVTNQTVVEDLTLPEKGVSISNNIHITSPNPDELISSPVKITGEVRVFENQFNIRIKDSDGKVLAEESAMAESGDMGQLNPFEKEVSYPTPSTLDGTIEVFDYSAKDGSEMDKVIIPIKFD